MKPVRSLSFGVAAWLLMLMSASLSAQETLEGEWRLNVAKSTWTPNNLAIDRSTMRFQTTGGRTRVEVEDFNSRGSLTRTEYTTAFDGNEASPFQSDVEGNRNSAFDQVIWVKHDPNTYDMVLRLNRQNLTTARVVVSPDGMTMTHTVTGRNAQGQTARHTLVYEKPRERGSRNERQSNESDGNERERAPRGRNR